MIGYSLKIIDKHAFERERKCKNEITIDSGGQEKKKKIWGNGGFQSLRKAEKVSRHKRNNMIN